MATSGDFCVATDIPSVRSLKSKLGASLLGLMMYLFAMSA